MVQAMNSRLAFDLLPAIASLPSPPAVVVQLHVEEDDRSGFVRYVTTRYGNLVDAFSIVSEHLTRTVVEEYEMPRFRCHTIHLGVDAEREFSPERAEPVSEVERGPFNVLYPVRLVRQKDPLTMVDAAAALRDSGVDFRVHVVGEGDLEPQVPDAVAARGLEGHVLLHGSRADMPGWYAACDAVLLTSVFEGVPVVVYEAMAMAKPLVSPRLEPIAEVAGEESAVLVEPGAPGAAYADALAELARNPDRRQRIGEAARARVRQEFALERTARAHEQLYEQIAPPERSPADSRQPTADKLRFRTRPSRGTPLVSVVIPCFNHGRFLEQCLDSIRAQAYPNVETIVVDDASTDPETLALLDRLHDVELVRMERNSGPGAARNAGVERAGGRYVLPVDADNLLPPGAVERLVEQLQGAGEEIGFVYPAIQYFGTRDDLFEPPAYNLYHLMLGNYCDTGSLVDREVFDAGVRYLEEPRMAHEDWDFFLQLGARGVYGEPSTAVALHARKHGFTRSDTITFGEDRHETRLRHPELYGDENDPLGGVEAKRRWTPALSIVALAPEAERAVIEERIARQSCPDFELIVRSDGEWPDDVRRLPAALDATPGEALADAAAAASGRFLFATSGTAAEELAEPGFVERLLRLFAAREDVHAIAFADGGRPELYPWRVIEPGAGEPHAVAWRATQPQRLPEPLPVNEHHQVGAIVRSHSHNEVPIQWRQLPAPAVPEPAGKPLRNADVRLRGPHAPRERERADKEHRMTAEPLLPGVPRDWLPGLTGAIAWTPPETMLLHRWIDPRTKERVVTSAGVAPEGCELEYWLGAVNRFPRPGTTPLVAIGRLTQADFLAGRRPEREDQTLLGHVELPPRPMLDELFLAEHRGTGQRVLVSGEGDPIRDEVTIVERLGLIEPYPSNPRAAPGDERSSFGAIGLLRAVDHEQRRHAYGAGFVPQGELAGELGALHDLRERDSLPVWILEDGKVVVGDREPDTARASLRATARWALAPATWEGVATPGARARAAARRTLSSLRHVAAPHGSASPNGSPPDGWLYALARPVTLLHRELIPLYSSTHPVTRDQFLSNDQREGGELGYVDTELLGWLLPVAPVTGHVGTAPRDIAWASRFGQVARD